MPPLTISGIDELKDLIGKPIRPSDWVEITQDDIETFARLSRDDQWIYAGARGLARPRGLSCVVSHWMPGVRRRFAPHQLRHAHAVEMGREGVPLNVIQRQLGHANLRVTSVYLQGIDNTEVISAVHSRRAPTMPASAGLLV
jgi:integrase